METATPDSIASYFARDFYTEAAKEDPTLPPWGELDPVRRQAWVTAAQHTYAAILGVIQAHVSIAVEERFRKSIAEVTAPTSRLNGGSRTLARPPRRPVKPAEDSKDS